MARKPYYFPTTREEWNEPDPYWPGLNKGQAAEKRAAIEDFVTYVTRLAKDNWPALEELNELEPEDADQFRRGMALHLEGAIERLSTYEQALVVKI
jgi:hypothetical protein